LNPVTGLFNVPFMKCWLDRCSAGLIVLAAAVSGCGPVAQSRLDEEKEPRYLAGKSRVSSLDYKGAIECFEQALDLNPRSASAHFELAWLLDQNEGDAAAAIYHYSKYLALRPAAENADLIKQRIVACKQDLARTVSLGPVSEKVQRELEQLLEENRQLNQENKRLNEALEQWRGFAARPNSGTNSTGLRGAASHLPGSGSEAGKAVRESKAAAMADSDQRLGSRSVGRTHTVQPGETPILIARKYGVRLDALLAANPRLDPRRLKVGQALSLPAP
jgi:tetratricopeptide (TPR) repeat protein